MELPKASQGFKNAFASPAGMRLPLSDAQALADTGAEAAGAARAKLSLRILATSDLHMAITPYNYDADRPSIHRGLARTASLIDAARAEAPNCILLDNGDFMNGSLLDTFWRRSPGRIHPMIAAMNTLGYDAVNLGNHEFSEGLEILRSCQKAADFPLVSANTHWHESGAPFVAPFGILERELTDHAGGVHLVRIGVTGALPPQTALWDADTIAGRIAFTPMRRALEQAVQTLRAQGADVVIVLAHCGPEEDREAPCQPDENCGQTIAQIKGIDAMVLGHVHTLFPADGRRRGRLNGVPCVMPGHLGSHLGVIDLELALGARGWAVCKARGGLRAIMRRNRAGKSRALVTPSPALMELCAPLHQATLRATRQRIGHLPRAVHSYFAMARDCTATRLINLAQMDYGARQLAGTQWERLPLLSAASTFKAGGYAGPNSFSHVEPGDFLLRHIFDLYTFPNTLVGAPLSGAQLTEWLERSARAFLPRAADLPKEAVSPLRNEAVPHFNFDVILGLSYQIDLRASSPEQSGPRIRDLRYKGQPVRPEQEFLLLTNSYRASGGGALNAPLAAQVLPGAPRLCRDILIDYIRKGPDLEALFEAQPSWEFAPMGGLPFAFESAPASRCHLAEIAHLRPEILGQSKKGFLQYRLWL